MIFLLATSTLLHGTYIYNPHLNIISEAKMRVRRIIPVICVGLLLFNAGIGGMGDVRHAASGDGVQISETPGNDAYELLIIAPAAFVEALGPLVAHKEHQGVATKLVSLDEIYGGTYFSVNGRDDAEKIKYFIKNAIEEWGIEYVMLVGGRKPSVTSEEWWLPVRYSHIEDNVATREDRVVSDLYCADIYDESGNFSDWDTNGNGVFSEWLANRPADDIMDLYPDVCVGRLPCRNAFEVGIMVNKIIAYESRKCPDSWFRKMVVVGGDTYTDNDYYEGEVATQEALDRMPGFEPVRLWTSDGSLTGWRDVIRAFNEGCGFIYFAGHGSPTTWATHPPYDEETWIYGLQTFQMPLLSNGDMLPVCVVGGCHNSMFNISIFHSSWTFGLSVMECWSWRLTRSIRGGAIATLGCTGLGYGKEDKQGPVKDGAGDWLNTLFFEEYGMEGSHMLGEAWAGAITSYLNQFPVDYTRRAFDDTALDAKTVQEWVLLGDPSLKIGGYE
ncbi:MAG: hypothetical protein DRN37_02265 [Thermoplasmata archaeon]|nr:MAG: hypothetical protein DRN37_02265 [Thermoplasmata archaeon]